MKKQIVVIFSLLLLIFANLSETVAAPYYEGKVIKIVVGYKPGGGYDRMARLVAKHLPKHLPGKPAIIIENMEGASSIIAANYLFNIAKPDGLTIGTFNRAIPFAQLTKQAGVKFDVLKYVWIGSTSVESTVLAVRTDLPFKTVDDILKAKSPIILGSTGPTEISSQFPTMLKEYAGPNMAVKLIIYPSSADVMLAIERKEVDGRAGSYSSIKPFMDRGVLRPIVRGRVAEKGTEQLPVNEDLAVSKLGKSVMYMFSVADLIGRPYVCPPGTPPAQMNILTDGFAKLGHDPQMIEDSRRWSMEIQYTSGKEILSVINSFFNQPQDVIAEFSRHVKF
jgi:tripartite-type tricarboxylate transporter receptor subunit TctC